MNAPYGMSQADSAVIFLNKNNLCSYDNFCLQLTYCCPTRLPPLFVRCCIPRQAHLYDCVSCVFQPQITLFVHTPEIEFVDSKVHGKLILSVLHCVFILSYFCFWVSAKLRQLWKAYSMYNQHTLLNWQKCGSLSQIPTFTSIRLRCLLYWNHFKPGCSGASVQL